MLVQFAFFGAYFVGSLCYFLISWSTGDPIAKIGYKNGVIIGLLISAMGSALFWPAATIVSYPLVLMALFIVGLGFAMVCKSRPIRTSPSLGPEVNCFQPVESGSGFQFRRHHGGVRLIGGILIFEYFAKSGVSGRRLGEKCCIWPSALCFSASRGYLFLLFNSPHVGEGKIERGRGCAEISACGPGRDRHFYVRRWGSFHRQSSIINFLGQPDVAGMGAIGGEQIRTPYSGAEC